MKKINVLIIEDNDFEANLLKEHLEKNDCRVVAIASNLKQALSLYYTEHIDIVVIDIFLNGNPDGITFANKVNLNKNTLKPFVFLTGHMDRAIFEKAKIEQPFSFLLKPFNKLEVLYAIELALEKSVNDMGHKEKKSEANNDAFFIKKNSVLHKILLNDISCVEVEGRYSKIMADKNTFLLEHTLVDLQRRLPKSVFARSHRNFIVNMNKVKEVHYNDNLIILEDNVKALLGRSYKNDFIHGYSVLS